MDRIEMAVLRLKGQRDYLREEKEDAEEDYQAGRYEFSKRGSKREILLLGMKIEALDYVLNFLENTKEEVCQD